MIAKIQIIEEPADYENSIKILKENGLELLTYQEALSTLSKASILKGKLKDTWFWLAGQGMDKAGIFTIDEKGELAEIGKRKLSKEKKVRVWSGNQPLSLFVGSDDYASIGGRRFSLGASDGPHVVAPVVVGVIVALIYKELDERLKEQNFMRSLPKTEEATP